MEDEAKRRQLHTITEAKRRYNVPPSVLIPAKIEFIPIVKPQKLSPSVCNGGHHYYRQPSPTYSTSPSADLELVCFKSSPMYTSLKDLLPCSSPSLLSPKLAAAAAANSTISGGTLSISGYEICIRNRLVKQAAWAYLQPMCMTPSASGPRLFSGDFIRLCFSAVKRAVVHLAARACNCLVEPLWLIL